MVEKIATFYLREPFFSTVYEKLRNFEQTFLKKLVHEYLFLKNFKIVQNKIQRTFFYKLLVST